MAGAAAVMAIAGLSYAVAAWHVTTPADIFAFRGFNTIIALELAATGLILARKRAANPIGWLLLVAAVFAGLNALAEGFALWAVGGNGSSTTIARLAAIGEEWIWIVAFSMLALVLAVFPDGHAVSRRWRRVLMVGLAGTAVCIVSYILTDEPSVFRNVENPLAVRGAAAVGNATIPFFLVLLVSGFANLVIRLRRSTGDEHEQSKWLAASASLLVVAFAGYLLGFTIFGAEAGDSVLMVRIAEGVMIVGILTVPVTIAIAILKYRLYDIDVVIKKTVIFACVVVVVTVFYMAVAVALPTAVVGIGSHIQAQAVAIGLVIGLSIIPIRNRARRFADRVVYGKRATPYEVLEEFSGRMSETYATEDVLPRMARILGEAVGGAQALVWLRIDDELRPAGRWPTDSPSPDPVRLPADGEPPFDESLFVPVRHRSDLLGALQVVMPANDPMDPERERLVHGLASQAGLVLRNARLIEELRASRQRLVAAQDEERRKIERNIHDGAQQQLVALAVKQRLAASLIGKDDERASAMLEQLQSDTAGALEDLRDLARGIYPPLLADKGLVTALEARSRKAAIPVSIVPDGIRRYPQPVEAAVYFSVLEALQNTTKYAQATRATVVLGDDGSSLTFAVADDGVGFDPPTTSYGTGLQGMADRLDAVGGRLEVQSSPGHGTRVSGSVRATPATT